MIGSSLKNPTAQSKPRFGTFAANSDPWQEKHKPKYAFPIEIDLGALVNSKVGSFAELSTSNIPQMNDNTAVNTEENAGII